MWLRRLHTYLKCLPLFYRNSRPLKRSYPYSLWRYRSVLSSQFPQKNPQDYPYAWLFIFKISTWCVECWIRYLITPIPIVALFVAFIIVVVFISLFFVFVLLLFWLFSSDPPRGRLGLVIAHDFWLSFFCTRILSQMEIKYAYSICIVFISSVGDSNSGKS